MVSFSKLRFVPRIFCFGALGILIATGSACAGNSLEVNRPGALDSNRVVELRDLRGTFAVRQSELHRFVVGRPSRRQRNRDAKLKAESAAFAQKLRRYVTNGMMLNGFAPAGGETGRSPGLAFSGTMHLELVRGLFWDRTRVRFKGQLTSLNDGAIVARGEIKDSFSASGVRRFQQLMTGKLEAPIRDWFDTLEREH